MLLDEVVVSLPINLDGVGLGEGQKPGLNRFDHEANSVMEGHPRVMGRSFFLARMSSMVSDIFLTDAAG